MQTTGKQFFLPGLAGQCQRLLSMRQRSSWIKEIPAQLCQIPFGLYQTGSISSTFSNLQRRVQERRRLFEMIAVACVESSLQVEGSALHSCYMRVLSELQHGRIGGVSLLDFVVQFIGVTQLRVEVLHGGEVLLQKGFSR